MNSARQTTVSGALTIALALGVLCLYARVGGFAFLNYDDDLYVYANAHVSQGLSARGVSWAFTAFQAGNWHPLTWLSHMGDVSLFGLAPGWHHRMNVLLHALNTALLFLVLRRMTGAMWQSAVVAALFGVHPLHVESVAWVSERKDLLSTTFWILTMGAYARYVGRPSVVRYLPVAALFALGLLCKPMLVTLPFALLLLDVWPLARLDPKAFSLQAAVPLCIEKLPLIAISAASCVVTYAAQLEGGAVTMLAPIPFGARVANALVACATYLERTFWPASLAVFYPHPASVHAVIPAWRIAGASLLLVAVSLWTLRQFQRRPYLAVGWLWFLGTLVPVLGLIQVGGQAMADRYMYVPSMGLFVMIAWGTWRPARTLRVAAALLAITALSVATWHQLGYWRDDVSLFGRAIAVTQKNWLAWTNLGVAHQKAGQFERAEADFQTALRFRPTHAAAWFDLGVVREQLGQPDSAESDYRNAVQIAPDYASPWYNLGVLEQRSGRDRQALECYRAAVRADPQYADAWDNMGASYAHLFEFQRAAECLREAVRLQPRHARAWYNLGMVELVLGDREAARDAQRRLSEIDFEQGQALLAVLDSTRLERGATPGTAAHGTAPGHGP